MGSKISISRALENLRSSDVIARCWAIHYLEDLDCAEAVAALIELMDHPDAQMRAFTVSALQKVPTGGEILLAHLKNDPSVMVRYSCAKEFGQPEYPFPFAVRALIEALRDVDERVVQMACWAFRRKGAEQEGAGQEGADDAIVALQQLLDHESWGIRFSACEGLYYLKGTDQQAVATLEALDQQPEAVEHNKTVLGWRQLDEETDAPVCSVRPRESFSSWRGSSWHRCTCDFAESSGLTDLLLARTSPPG